MDQSTKHPYDDSGVDRRWKKKTGIFISSQSLSLFGSMLVQYAIIWHITLTYQSGSVMTLATLAGFLPQIIISLFAGVWADRYPRKLLIVGADALTAASTLVLALFFLFGYRELWLIFLISGIRSVGAGIQLPAVNALLPQIVPGDQLMRVNSINSTVQPFIMILSPILAGALMSFSRLEAIFFVDVVTAALAIGLVLSLRIPPLPKRNATQNAGYLGDLRAGLVYIWHNQTIRTLFIFFAFIFFLVTPAAFLTPLLVTREFGDEVWRLTANEVVFFAGSILGGAFMTYWGGFPNRFRTIGLGSLLWAGLFAGLGYAHNFTVYLVLMGLAGIPMPFFNASSVTLMQEMTEPEMQGRVFGVQSLITNTVMPIGMLVYGPLADVVGIALLLAVTSLLMAATGLWIFFYGRHVPVRLGSDREPEFEMHPGD